MGKRRRKWANCISGAFTDLSSVVLGQKKLFSTINKIIFPYFNHENNKTDIVLSRKADHSQKMRDDFFFRGKIAVCSGTVSWEGWGRRGKGESQSHPGFDKLAKGEGDSYFRPMSGLD